ncbi:MAG: nitroreductase family protein [Oscillospiraceae bacterium]|nr:nitroreductase family protein [Oscillospiraceae bacterium]
MAVLKVIRERKSIRKYKDTPVEQEKLMNVLEAARLAPSARNLQDWKFIAVTDPEKRPALQEACGGQRQVAQAPVTLVVCANNDSNMSCGQSKTSVDCSIAMSFMLLQAEEEGLGMCWLGHFYEDKIKELLNIPEDYIVVAVSPLGYADEDPAPKPRKAAEEVICFNEFR